MRAPSRSAAERRAGAGPPPVVEPAAAASSAQAAPAAAPPGPPLRWLVVSVDWFNAVLLTVLALVLGALTVLGFAQVIARYLLEQPLVWSEELIRYALIWTVFLGVGITVRKGMMPAVEVVTHMAPEAVRRPFSWACLLVSAAFWLVLLVFGIQITGSVAGLSSGAMELPMSWVYTAVPAGAGLALVNTLVTALDPPVPSLEGAVD